ncbi:monovalent cation/H(+) antiporter subunit G [Alcanivorax sp. 1008]|uniref:monovalent cation/H(+) antiporter subunit G n=1 Tax=Alcanivorax sp. 1008 TaxID=2816853 RepID=UPI001D6EFB67|nr:monovalent cation/H(+) antiporter subunit G [Alcanivorax sp. 1008]MCC1496057.1 monovalent cation/H(+) antiporter subunit G [Alcanivorax sp. 1008]
MTEWIAAPLLLAGSLLMLLAALGALRMPDLLMRMHATTKAGALGSGLIMLAAAVFFGSAEVWARVLAIIAFIMLTAPVAAHMIGRAGYFVGVPLWGRILRDDLKGRYHTDNHSLESPPEFSERRQHEERRGQ